MLLTNDTGLSETSLDNSINSVFSFESAIEKVMPNGVNCFSAFTDWVDRFADVREIQVKFTVTS